jgi:hypothetical protein
VKGEQSSKAKKDEPKKFSGTDILIQVYVRQKWIEVLYTEGTLWGKFGLYLRKRLKLKQWRWRLDEKMEDESWCKKSEDPFSITAGKKYRIVLQGPRVRSHPGRESGPIHEQGSGANFFVT